MELDERVKKLEETFTFLRGVVYAAFVLIPFFTGVIGFTLIPDQIVKQLDETIGVETRETINKAHKKADDFLAHDVHKMWPEGSYCVLKSKKCPKDFTEYQGKLHAIWMAKGDSSYLEPGEFGDSSIKHHVAKDRKKGDADWHGELNISACCK